MRRLQRYSPEFKRKAVALSQLPDFEEQAVAEALEIHPFMLSRWRQQAREGALRGGNVLGCVGTALVVMRADIAGQGDRAVGEMAVRIARTKTAGNVVGGTLLVAGVYGGRRADVRGRLLGQEEVS